MRETGGRPVNWQQPDPAEAAENLQLSERGLASKEARKRYEQYGPNELIGKGKKKAWKILVMGLIIGLISVGTGYWFWDGGTCLNAWQTMVFTMLTFCQMAYAPCVRKKKRNRCLRNPGSATRCCCCPLASN